MITVLLAEDHPLYRDGMVRAITERKDISIVAECGDGAEALASILELKPTVALLDFRLPELNALEILAELERHGSHTRALVVSAFKGGADVYAALEAGAAGYIPKEADRSTICEAIVAVAHGGTFVAAELQSAVVEQIRDRRDGDGVALTTREREILGLTADGMGANEIGEKLFLSGSTVKKHLQRIYEKLGVSDRAAAVAEAMRRGILQ